jgi:VanZ family protein
MKIKVLALLGFLSLLYLIWAANSGCLPAMATAIYEFPNGDKISHFVLYGLIAFLLTLAFPRTWQARRFRIPIITLFFLLFAIVEEWSQSLFPLRTADVIDGICSCLGILVGTWTAYYRMKKKPYDHQE